METRIVKSGVNREGRERVEVRREIKRIVIVQLVVTAIVLSAKETSIESMIQISTTMINDIIPIHQEDLLKDRERISSS